MCNRLDTIPACRVKIKGVLHGGFMASDSEPENFFSFDPPNPPWSQDFNPN